MGKTELSIKLDKFMINNQLIYSEIDQCPYQGLLMNARFIQGIFDDKIDRSRFQRFNRLFDAENNTVKMIEALPSWYEAGLRAITVGFQGGGPCFTLDSNTINNNPYEKDGKNMDSSYLDRMGKIIDAADRIGMVVIVSLFYGAQTRFLQDDEAVEQATLSVCKWLKSRGYGNVIIEIANEHDFGYEIHPILNTSEGIVKLIEIARQESGGMPVGCSGSGGYFSEDIANISDVILIHGNGQTRQQLYQLIKKAKAIKPVRPIVINEDSQALSQLEVAFKNGVSWGYYNNMTKQEPPVDWSITHGEDRFYAMRLQEYLKGKKWSIPLSEQFYLQGLEKDMVYEEKRFIRIASLYPGKINYVEFYRDNVLFDIAYEDPYLVNYLSNWRQEPVLNIRTGEEWKAVIYLRNGEIVEKVVVVQ